MKRNRLALFSLVLVVLLGASCGSVQRDGDAQTAADTVSMTGTASEGDSVTATGDPLHEAAKEGSTEAVRALLDDGASIDAEDEQGRTPLYLAAARGHVAVVRLLIDHGANVNARGKITIGTPLHRAAAEGREAVVRALIDGGARINIGDDFGGETPLHRAAHSGEEAVARLLIDRGARVNARSDDGATPLHRAVNEGHDAVVRLLKKHRHSPGSHRDPVVLDGSYTNRSASAGMRPYSSTSTRTLHFDGTQYLIRFRVDCEDLPVDSVSMIELLEVPTGVDVEKWYHYNTDAKTYKYNKIKPQRHALLSGSMRLADVRVEKQPSPSYYEKEESIKQMHYRLDAENLSFEDGTEVPSVRTQEHACFVEDESDAKQ